MTFTAMKSPTTFWGVFLKATLLVLLIASCEGCRRRAKAVTGEATAETAVESSAPQKVQVGESVVILAPAPAITNNVAPPLRMDAQTGKPILQGDTTVVKKRTATE